MLTFANALQKLPKRKVGLPGKLETEVTRWRRETVHYVFIRNYLLSLCQCVRSKAYNTVSMYTQIVLWVGTQV